MVKIMPKKFYILCGLIIVIFGIFIDRVINLAYNKHDYYLNKYIICDIKISKADE